MRLLSVRKRKSDSGKLFVASLEQAVLAFLLKDPERSYYSVELSDDAGLSRGGVNQALHTLEAAGLVLAVEVGPKRFYRANLDDERVKAFRTLLAAISTGHRH